MKNPFSVHSLLFGTAINSTTLPPMLQMIKHFRISDPVIEDLGNPPKLLQCRGGIELAFHPTLFNPADTERLGEICLAAGVPINALCVFFGADDLDPLKEATREAALERILTAAKCAVQLGDMTGVTPVITGPWAYRIGSKYPRNDATLRRVELFLMLVSQMMTDGNEFENVLFALEILRPAECAAVQGYPAIAEFMTHLSPFMGIHIDTFHVDLWEGSIDPTELLEMFGNRIHWLHVSGTDRHTPGYQGGRINWKAWATAINKVGYAGPICFEGFGPDFRAAVPEIGNGFPPDLDPEESIGLCLDTLREAGFKI